MEKILSVRKVGFIGTSPSSRHLAPFDNPDWEIWGCGPAFQDEGTQTMPGYPNMRWSRWFELHDMTENDPSLGGVVNPGYWEWLAKQTKPVYLRPPRYKDLPGLDFPWDEIWERHGGYFLDSTPAWMMAFAHDYFPEIEAVGLYGIDFSTEPERQVQKKGCYHFIHLFDLRGVKVHIPHESDMYYEPLPYPDMDPYQKKLGIQKNFLIQKRTTAEQKHEQFKQAMIQQEADILRLGGAIEQVEYFESNPRNFYMKEKP